MNSFFLKGPALLLSAVTIFLHPFIRIALPHAAENRMQHKVDTVVNDSARIFSVSPSKIQLIADNFSFTEGASVDRKGNVYFTDQPNNKIWKYSIDGKLSVFKYSAGRSNGMYFDSKGNLISCADENDELWSISPKGKIAVLVNNFQGHKLNGPNDVWVSKTGGIYFTDPYYQRSYWKRTQSDLDGEKVYYLAKSSHNPIVIAADLVKPNGIVGTPDGRYLYIADIGANKTYKYKIGPGGELLDKTLFINKGADGITLDEQGNLYMAGDGITVVNSTGKVIAHIHVPQPWTANLCFGGKHKNILFITASKALYMLPMKVHGVE